MPLVSLAQGYLDGRLTEKRPPAPHTHPTQAQLWTVPTTTLSSGGCGGELSQRMAPSLHCLMTLVLVARESHLPQGD